jgi:hypothetical protein
MPTFVMPTFRSPALSMGGEESSNRKMGTLVAPLFPANRDAGLKNLFLGPMILAGKPAMLWIGVRSSLC